MHDTAEAHSHTLTTNRNCTIEITNVSGSYCLVNPKVYMVNGYVYNPPQPTLRPTMTEVCSFIKDDHTASGAVGVMTYELFNMHTRTCKELIAVMFSVPFDYNFYKNWLGVGIFEHGRACDEELYDFMYNKKDFKSFCRYKADGSGLTFRGETLDVRACMSDEGKAIVKMELYDKMR